ncbi:hypothetical protein [Rhodoblastus sp.]|uniref:hypothetical protein n=2 Tax=Rhodoblastus sp. TaxID=1962975 RepID=UPI003F9C23CD
MTMNSKRNSKLLAAVFLVLAASPAPVMAKGCIKGAIVGGVAGHMVGHGKMGAAAGCVVGHHNANKTQPGASDQPDASQNR